MYLKVKDFWLPNTSYSSSDRVRSLIVYDDKQYLCNVAHVSTDTFDPTKFIEISGSGGGGLIPNFEWDIAQSTTISPLIQRPAILLTGLDATVTGGVVNKNPNLSMYNVDGVLLFGGASQNNIVNDFSVRKWFELEVVNSIDPYVITLSQHLTGDAAITELIAEESENSPLTRNTLSFFVFKQGGNVTVSLRSATAGNLFTGLGNGTIPLTSDRIKIGIGTDSVIFKDGIEEVEIPYSNTLLTNSRLTLAVTAYFVSPIAVRESFRIYQPLDDELFPPILQEFQSVEYTFPEGVVDGDVLMAVSNGSFDDITIKANDIVVPYNDLNDIIVIYSDIHDKLSDIDTSLAQLAANLLSGFDQVKLRGVIDQLEGVRPNVAPELYTMIENDELIFKKNGEWFTATDLLSPNDEFNYSGYNVKLAYYFNIQAPVVKYDYAGLAVYQGTALFSFLQNTQRWKLANTTVAVTKPTYFKVFTDVDGIIVSNFANYQNNHLVINYSNTVLSANQYTVFVQGVSTSFDSPSRELSLVNIEPQLITFENATDFEITVRYETDLYLADMGLYSTAFVLAPKKRTTFGYKVLLNENNPDNNGRTFVTVVEQGFKTIQEVTGDADLLPNVNRVLLNGTVTTLNAFVDNYFDGMEFTLHNLNIVPQTISFSITDRNSNVQTTSITIPESVTGKVVYYDNGLYVVF